mmetsp:Transcript_58317/g.170530  ORF Transcript_58317/g.170530 Transcript_58317/m.170530 type:complete len:218 (-) Transcript_58317:50-703(-)
MRADCWHCRCSPRTGERSTQQTQLATVGLGQLDQVLLQHAGGGLHELLEVDEIVAVGVRLAHDLLELLLILQPREPEGLEGLLQLLLVQLTTAVLVRVVKQLPECHLAEGGVGGVQELLHEVAVGLDHLAAHLRQLLLAQNRLGGLDRRGEDAVLRLAGPGHTEPPAGGARRLHPGRPQLPPEQQGSSAGHHEAGERGRAGRRRHLCEAVLCPALGA